MMQRFWSWLAVNLGNTVIVTAVLAAHDPGRHRHHRLEFATGQTAT